MRREIKKLEIPEGIEVPDFENLKNVCCTEKYLKRHYFRFWEYINKNYKYFNTWKQKIHYFRQGIKEEEIHSMQNINGIEILVPNEKFYHDGGAIEKHLFNLYPEFCNYLNITYHYISSFKEKKYLFYHNMIIPPKCPVCGNIVNFGCESYHRFCSETCTGLGTIELKKETNKRLHGDENYNNIEQYKKTNFERYGVDNIMKLPEKREQAKQTKLIIYGDPFYNNREQAKQTSRKLYNTDHPMQNIVVKNKVTKANQTKFINQVDWLLGYDEDGNYICKCPHESEYPYKEICKTCQKTFISPCEIHYDRSRNNIETCTIIKPLYSNESNIEISIQQILDKFEIIYLIRNKKLIKGFNRNMRELDIYIPSLNLAIEINGMFYHSISNPNNTNKILGHYEKYIQCKEKGIELIYLWEDWIKDDIKLVEEFLFDKLNNNDLSKYKSNWFSDLDDSQWPLDLGWYKELILNERVIPHLCQHGSFLCFDSGFLRID